MKIDREQLTELLVEKSGLDEEQVASQLDTLVERIRNAAREGKSFHIEGFGTFVAKGEELLFEPDETLQTEVNQKYAGMKPIELIGAYRDRAAGEAGADDENVVEAGGEATTASRRDKIRARAEKARNEAARRAETEGEAEEPASTEQEETPAPPVPETEGAEETVEPEKEKKVRPAGKETAKEGFKKARAEGRKSRDRQPLSAVAARILGISLILFAVMAAGWWAWDAGWLEEETAPELPAVEEPDNRPSMSQEQDQPLEAQQGGEEIQQQTDQQNSEQGDEQAVSGDESGQNAVSGGEATERQPAYGLRGETNAQLASFYTIVVHSLTNQSRADRMAEGLMEQGYRVSVRSATVDGTAHWRVGIGQFESVQSAREAAEDIPEPYRSDHFIRNFQ